MLNHLIITLTPNLIIGFGAFLSNKIRVLLYIGYFKRNIFLQRNKAICSPFKARYYPI